MKLADIEILRTPCEVHVNENGYFSVYLQGRAEEEGAKELGGSYTFEKAVENAKPVIRTRRIKVNVPYYDTHLQRFVAVGFHAGTGNLLLSDGSQLSTYGGYRSRPFRGDMPDEKRAELMRLRNQRGEVDRQIDTIESEYTFDLAEAVQAAIDEAQS